MKIILIILILLTTFLQAYATDSIKTNPNNSSVLVHKKVKVDSLSQKSTERYPETRKKTGINVPRITINNNIPENKINYLSAIIPIITLILGFILNKWYESYTSKKKLKKNGTQWVEYFIQLQSPLTVQIEKLRTYIPLNDENNFKMTDPYFNIRLDCQEFSSLDSKALIHYLNSGKNKLDYRKSVILAGELKDVVKLIEHNSKSYKDQIKIMTTEVSSHISMVNPLLNEFKILVAQYWDSANAEHTEFDPIMVEAKKMYHLMQVHILPNLDSGEFDLFKLSDEFIKTFFNATYVDRDNPNIININKILNSIDMHIKAIRMEKKYFRIHLEKILKSYQEQLNSVSEMILKPEISNK